MSGQTRFPWLPPAGRIGRKPARGASLVPRMAPAAVRIPDPRVAQLPLAFSTGPQIFVHEGARQVIERRFSAAFAGPVHLAITDNRHRMVTHNLEDGTLRVRLHMMFMGAPEPILDALVAYVLHDCRRASQVLGEYIQANSHRIRALREVTGPLRTRGRVHDLVQILARINDTYFGSSLTDLLITWGRKSQPLSKKRTSIKLGSYSAVERLIRVHPALDAEWVPHYFVSYIVYHEVLHHWVPAELHGGRVLVHPPAFMARERQFRFYERAIEWERRHIDRLLRSK